MSTCSSVMVRLSFNNKLCELILRPACLFLVKRKERTLSATRYGLLLFHFYDKNINWFYFWGHEMPKVTSLIIN